MIEIIGIRCPDQSCPNCGTSFSMFIYDGQYPEIGAMYNCF